MTNKKPDEIDPLTPLAAADRPTKSRKRLPNQDKVTDNNITLPLEAVMTSFAKQTISTTVEGRSAQWSTKQDRQEFFIPVSNFVWFYPEEVEVIGHPAFQRLGRINQLGQTHLVFRGATHKRIEHALGAVAIVERMIRSTTYNSEKRKTSGQRLARPLSTPEQRFLRLGALLHDIGHVAGGHTLEDELGILRKHDADGRLDRVFTGEKAVKNRYGRTLGDVIDGQYAKYVPEGLSSIGPSVIVRLMIRKLPTTDDKYDASADPHAEAYTILRVSGELRLNICANMIGNTICADLLDYLHRDWHHIGRPQPFEERILQYMELSKANNIKRTGTGDADDEFVISLGRSPNIRTDGVSSILSLLEWRYELAEVAIFHRTKLSAAAMLDRAFFALHRDENLETLEDFVLPLSDDQLIDASIVSAEQRLHLLMSGGGEPKDDAKRIDIETSLHLLRSLRDRTLYKTLKTRFFKDMKAEYNDLRRRYGNSREALGRGARNRAHAARTLENDFALPGGSIVMYWAEIEPKIAEVKIWVDGGIAPLWRHESEEEADGLTGGHLGAQLERFKRLSRVLFFVDPDVKERLRSEGLLEHMEDVVTNVILSTDLEKASREVERLASYLTRHAKSCWYKKEVKSEPMLAVAKSRDAGGGALGYPGDIPSIRMFIGE